jgi:hypothetical protein
VVEELIRGAYIQKKSLGNFCVLAIVFPKEEEVPS